jgi:hypothetical protein
MLVKARKKSSADRNAYLQKIEKMYGNHFETIRAEFKQNHPTYKLPFVPMPQEVWNYVASFLLPHERPPHWKTMAASSVMIPVKLRPNKRPRDSNKDTRNPKKARVKKDEIPVSNVATPGESSLSQSISPLKDKRAHQESSDKTVNKQRHVTKTNDLSQSEFVSHIDNQSPFQASSAGPTHQKSSVHPNDALVSSQSSSPSEDTQAHQPNSDDVINAYPVSMSISPLKDQPGRQTSSDKTVQPTSSMTNDDASSQSRSNSPLKHNRDNQSINDNPVHIQSPVTKDDALSPSNPVSPLTKKRAQQSSSDNTVQNKSRMCKDDSPVTKSVGDITICSTTLVTTNDTLSTPKRAPSLMQENDAIMAASRRIQYEMTERLRAETVDEQDEVIDQGVIPVNAHNTDHKLTHSTVSDDESSFVDIVSSSPPINASSIEACTKRATSDQLSHVHAKSLIPAFDAVSTKRVAQVEVPVLKSCVPVTVDMDVGPPMNNPVLNSSTLHPTSPTSDDDKYLRAVMPLPDVDSSAIPSSHNVHPTHLLSIATVTDDHAALPTSSSCDSTRSSEEASAPTHSVPPPSTEKSLFDYSLFDSPAQALLSKWTQVNDMNNNMLEQAKSAIADMKSKCVSSGMMTPDINECINVVSTQIDLLNKPLMSSYLSTLQDAAHSEHWHYTKILSAMRTIDSDIKESLCSLRKSLAYNPQND